MPSLLGLIAQCNSVPRLAEYSKTHDLVPLTYKGVVIGIYNRNALSCLSFDGLISSSGEIGGTPEEFDQMMERWRQADIKKVLSGSDHEVAKVEGCLKRWRGEKYEIRGAPGWWIERSVCGIFGIPTFGSHLNVYTRSPSGIHMWIARRASTKSTYPSMLDNAVAGGISILHTPTSTVIKEADEEADIPESIAKNVISVGAISYVTENSQVGFAPETEYLYDLEVTSEFILKPKDGEVDEFLLLDLDEVIERLKAGEFKPNSGLVCIDFLIRQGQITPENEPDYDRIVTGMRRDFWSELQGLLLDN